MPIPSKMQILFYCRLAISEFRTPYRTIPYCVEQSHYVFLYRTPISLYIPKRPYRTPFAWYQRAVSHVKLPSEKHRAIPLYRSCNHTNRGLARHSDNQESVAKPLHILEL